MADDIVATPRKMNPTPIQMARIRQPSKRLVSAMTPTISAAAPLTNSSRRPDEGNAQGEPEEHLLDAGHQQSGTEEDGCDADGNPGPREDRDTECDGQHAGHQ